MLKRIEWVDLARGIGIILVVIGHSPVWKPIEQWIYSFHMPLFFCISGYLFNDKNDTLPFIQILYKKIKTIYFPYILFSILFITSDFLFLGIEIDEIYKKLYYMIRGDGGFWVLWFFTSLFVVEILFSFLHKFVKKNIYIFAISCVGLILCYFHQLTFFKLSTSFVAIIFYYTGYIFRKNEFRININPVFVLLFLFINIIISYICFYYKSMTINMCTYTYTFGILSIVNALLGVYCVYYISKNICNIKILNIVKYIGKKSIIFFPITAYVPLLLNSMYRVPFEYKSIFIIAGFAVSFAVSFTMDKLKEKDMT